MTDALPGSHAVVLEDTESRRRELAVDSVGDAAHVLCDGRRFISRNIEQRRRMSLRDHDNVRRRDLPGKYERERRGQFLDHRTRGTSARFAQRYVLAEGARIALRNF
jgi:hypothetical protein